MFAQNPCDALNVYGFYEQGSTPPEVGSAVYHGLCSYVLNETTITIAIEGSFVKAHFPFHANHTWSVES